MEKQEWTLHTLWHDKRLRYGLAGVVVFSLWWGWPQSVSQPQDVPPIVHQPVHSGTSVASSEPTKISVSEEQWYVEIKGAVQQPGVYPVTPQMRVKDVVVLAGGFSETADVQQLNQAQKVHDQLSVTVPEKGEMLVQGAPPPDSISVAPASKIHLNTATKEQLMTLDGVGEKKAEQILAYRTEHGYFSSIEELAQVSGIGQKTIDKWRDQLIVP